MRAVGYFRDTKSRTLAEQSESFLEFCNSNGFEAAATFLDPGSRPEAPGFGQMLEFVRMQSPHGFLLVAVCELMSLGSGPTEAVRGEREGASLGVPIVMVNDEGDHSTDGTWRWSRDRCTG